MVQFRSVDHWSNIYGHQEPRKLCDVGKSRIVTIYFCYDNRKHDICMVSLLVLRNKIVYIHPSEFLTTVNNSFLTYILAHVAKRVNVQHRNTLYLCFPKVKYFDIYLKWCYGVLINSDVHIITHIGRFCGWAASIVGFVASFLGNVREKKLKGSGWWKVDVGYVTYAISRWVSSRGHWTKYQTTPACVVLQLLLLSYSLPYVIQRRKDDNEIRAIIW